jgi:hypothetical protein
MRKRLKSIHFAVPIWLGILMLSAAPVAAQTQTTPDFSGLWKQDNDRCQPKRSGDITLRIEHLAPALTVETTISRAPANPRQAVQKYTTDGKVSVSTGTDGDEFHTSIVWKGSSLVFSIEEHENGRILLSKETWSVIEEGATLERIREPINGEKQTLFYRRLPSGFRSGGSPARFGESGLGNEGLSVWLAYETADAAKRNWP